MILRRERPAKRFLVAGRTDEKPRFLGKVRVDPVVLQDVFYFGLVPPPPGGSGGGSGLSLS